MTDEQIAVMAEQIRERLSPEETDLLIGKLQSKRRIEKLAEDRSVAQGYYVTAPITCPACGRRM